MFGTVGSADKAAYARQFGYDEVVLRAGFAERIRELTGGRGVDLVLDSVGGQTRADSLDVLAVFGRLRRSGTRANYPDLTLAVRPLWKSNQFVGGFNIGDLRAALRNSSARFGRPRSTSSPRSRSASTSLTYCRSPTPASRSTASPPAPTAASSSCPSDRQ